MSDPERRDDPLDGWIVATIQRALAYAVTLLGERADAEDVVQDCYSRLLARAEVYDLPRDGTKLLFKAITHACINHTQRRKPLISWDVAQASGTDRGALADPAAVEPPLQAMRHELETAVDAALGQLPTAQRAVVQLQAMGHSLVEVAEILQISHANARTLLHRGRARLAVRLRPFLQEHVP